MRVIVKFSGALLIGICGILAVSAVDGYQHEVAFFESDMRLDHGVVGKAFAVMVRKEWDTEGREAALRVPHKVEQHERELLLATIDPQAGGADWTSLDEGDRASLRAHADVSRRVNGYVRTLVPVPGPGDDLLVLSIREPLDEEVKFSRASMWRIIGVTIGVVLLCTGLALVTGLRWVDRPIRVLVEAARRIGRGDLGGHVEIPGNNEFTLLASEVDAMRLQLVQAGADVARATEHRIAAIEQLRHADRLATIGRLAAGVAHELGTPLNVVGETAKMIGRGELTGPDLVEGAHTIVGQAERMAVVIRQLLDFARPRTPVKAETDLVALCRRTLQFLESTAQRAGVELRLLPQAGAAPAEVDAAQIEQVLTNLVVNAIQASPHGGLVEVDVVPVTAVPPAGVDGGRTDWHRIDVRDHGSGIDQEHMRRLFEPFFTTKGIGEGTGLGLSVSRGIVRENGGFLEVTSAPGAGSCFAVFLPRNGAAS